MSFAETGTKRLGSGQAPSEDYLRNPVKVITRSTDKVITDSRVSDHVPERSDAGIGL